MIAGCCVANQIAAAQRVAIGEHLGLIKQPQPAEFAASQ
jgi:hypothetical protein